MLESNIDLEGHSFPTLYQFKYACICVHACLFVWFWEVNSIANIDDTLPGIHGVEPFVSSPGIFILVGAGIFGVTVQEDDDAKIALCGSKTRLDQLAGVSNTYDTEIDLAWAFGLVAAAGAIFLVNGIALSVMAGCDNCSMQRFLPCHRNCFRAQDNYRERKGSAWWQFRRRNPYEDQHRPSVAYPSAPRQSVYPNNFLPVAASVPGYPSNSVPRYGYTNGTSPYAYGH